MEEIVEYQKRAMGKIKALSESRLKVALDFIEYLAEKEEWEATWEILSDKEAMENIKEADEAWESKRFSEFVQWEKVKRDVQDPSA